MKAESAANRLLVFWGGLIVLLLFSCSGKPISAQLPKAQNDDTMWQGKTLREWRWDLREFKDTQKCARASSTLARAGKLAVDGLSKDVNDDSVFFVNVWAAKALCGIGPDAKEAIPALQTAVATAQERGKSHRGWACFEPWGRAAIILISGENGDHIQRIGLSLQDRDASVRISTCRALEQLGSRAVEVLPALNLAKQDAKTSVQECAAEAIAAIERAR